MVKVITNDNNSILIYKHFKIACMNSREGNIKRKHLVRILTILEEIFDLSATGKFTFSLAISMDVF